MTRARTITRKTVVGLSLLLLAAFAGGCGGGGESGTAEQVLNDAQAALRDARNDVLEANENLRDKEEALSVAKAEVEKARERVRQAQTQLESVEKTVDLKATDGLLFRAIQRKLLDDDRLDDAAVRVHVNKGAVILRGTVAKAEQQEVALEVARSVPGVASVTSELSVAPAAG